MFLKKWFLSLVSIVTASERRMNKEVHVKFRSVQDLVRHSYEWSAEEQPYRYQPAVMVRKELRQLMSRPNIGNVDAYSAIRLEHYSHPEGSEHGYYEVVVRDDLGNWTVLPLMLMLHFHEQEYYLIPSSQVQGPVYKSSLIEA
jgi:hypothetical protein